MRCKICKVTFRTPSTNMRKTQICSLCQRYLDVKKGNRPENELKKVITKFQIREERKKRKPKNRKDGEEEIDEINKLISKALILIRIRPDGIATSELSQVLSVTKNELKKVITKFTIREEGEEEIDKINKLISKALILIRIRPDGISTSELSQKLSVTNDELKKLIPRLLRIDYIFQEEVISDDGISITKLYVDLSFCQLTDEEEFLRMKRVQSDQRIAENMIKLKVLNEREAKINKILAFDSNPVPAKVVTKNSKPIEQITQTMVNEYINDKKSINRQLKFKLINQYLKHKSLSKIYELNPSLSKYEIRKHLITIKRLPPKVQELEREGYFHSNLDCSIKIALFATDHFKWDGQNENDEHVINLAILISRCLKINRELNLIFEGKKKILII